MDTNIIQGSTVVQGTTERPDASMIVPSGRDGGVMASNILGSQITNTRGYETTATSEAVTAISGNTTVLSHEFASVKVIDNDPGRMTA